MFLLKIYSKFREQMEFLQKKKIAEWLHLLIYCLKKLKFSKKKKMNVDGLLEEIGS